MEEEIKNLEKNENVENDVVENKEPESVPEVPDTEVVEDEQTNEPDVEEAKQKVSKQINYSAALKEKNRKIQELKQRLKELEAQKEVEKQTIPEDDFNLFEAESNDEIKALKQEIESIKQELNAKKEQERLQQARMQLDNLLASLKQKYPDFDEARVLGEVVRRKGDYATPEDIELVYKAMKAEELLKRQQAQTAVTEGGSGGAVPEKKYNSYEDVIKEFLGEKT